MEDEFLGIRTRARGDRGSWLGDLCRVREHLNFLWETFVTLVSILDDNRGGIFTPSFNRMEEAPRNKHWTITWGEIMRPQSLQAPLNSLRLGILATSFPDGLVVRTFIWRDMMNDVMIFSTDAGGKKIVAMIVDESLV